MFIPPKKKRSHSYKHIPTRLIQDCRCSGSNRQCGCVLNLHTLETGWWTSYQASITQNWIPWKCLKMGKQSDNKSGCLNPWVTKMDARTWWKCGLATWNPPQIHLGLPTAQRRGFPVASLASDDEAVLWPRCRKAQCPNKLPPRGKQVGNPAKPRRQPPAIALKFLLLSAESVQRSNLAEPSNRPCSSTKQHHQRPLLTHISPTMTVRPRMRRANHLTTWGGSAHLTMGTKTASCFKEFPPKCQVPIWIQTGTPQQHPCVLDPEGAAQAWNPLAAPQLHHDSSVTGWVVEIGEHVPWNCQTNVVPAPDFGYPRKS